MDEDSISGLEEKQRRSEEERARGRRLIGDPGSEYDAQGRLLRYDYDEHGRPVEPGPPPEPEERQRRAPDSVVQGKRELEVEERHAHARPIIEERPGR